MRKFFLILFFAAAPVCFSQEAPKPFMGVNHRLVKELPDVQGAPEARGGVQITSVQKDTPADEAGLLAGDIMIGIDGFLFDIEPDSIQNKFREALYSHSPGEEMNVKILRLKVDADLKINRKSTDPEVILKSFSAVIDSLPPEKDLEFKMRKEWIVKDMTITLGAREEFKLPPLPEIETTDLGGMLIQHKDKPSAAWQPWVDEVVDRYKIRDEYEDLRARLKGIEAGDDGYRLAPMAAIHRNPFIFERYGRLFSDEIEAVAPVSLDKLFGRQDMAVFITGNKGGAKTPDLAPLPVLNGREDFGEDDFLKWFNSEAGKLIDDINGVFGELTEAEKEFFENHRFELSDVFADRTYIHLDDDEDRLANNLRIIEIGKKIDLDRLFQASHNVGIFLLKNEDRIFNWMKAHPDVRFLETEYGKIGFGTDQHDRWDKGDFKFIFDPGGDDFYANGTSTAASFAQPLSWIIDKRGADAYQSTSQGAQACGMPGVGVLIDRDGDDVYIGSRWAQGTGYFGVGILIDENGDDSYHGTEFIQGAGLFGMGVLADFEGDDEYFGTIHAQGTGFAKGFGLLADYGGDDRGYCTGKLPTGYGDAGIFDAWAQGCGMGFRGIASGGIGMVVDIGGEDRWEAGNFSQGGGYYYGFGIFMSAGGEDDEYIGSRYAQGFCAHEAAGLFIERGGDDFYTTRQGVNAGLAWDECVTVFIDEDGDDRYNGGTGFSLGASAHNGFCFFLDKDGRDEYIYKPGPARAGGNDYHGGCSFSFFVDLGGEKDVYASDKVRNDVELAWKEYGVFRDGKGEVQEPVGKPE